MESKQVSYGKELLAIIREGKTRSYKNIREAITDIYFKDFPDNFSLSDFPFKKIPFKGAVTMASDVDDFSSYIPRDFYNRKGAIEYDFAGLTIYVSAKYPIVELYDDTPGAVNSTFFLFS